MSIVDFIAVVSFGLTYFGLGYTFGKDDNKPQKQPLWSVICPLSSRQVRYLKVSDKNTYISFWSVGIFMHTISLYIF